MKERRDAGKPFTFYHYMLDLSGGPCIYKRISGCGSGSEYMAVTPWGDLYPCHQFVGEEAFRLGNIWQGVTNPEKRAEFASCNVYSTPNAGTAGRGSTAPAAARPTPTTPPGPSGASTRWAAGSSASGWSAPFSWPWTGCCGTRNEHAGLGFCPALCREDPLRLHMPGHKGVPGLGPEPWDLTEIPGADSLYEATGILRESEEEAGRLYGCPTFYSAEGSSLAVRGHGISGLPVGAGPGKTAQNRRRPERPPDLCHGGGAAGRAAPVDFRGDLPPVHPGPHRRGGGAGAGRHRPLLHQSRLPGPYPGDRGIGAALPPPGILLLVDSAHGAYLRFLPESRHPMDLGADLCCASAHKTLRL